MELIVIIVIAAVVVWFLLRLVGDIINLAAAVIAIAVWCLVLIIGSAEAALKLVARRHAHRRFDPPR